MKLLMLSILFSTSAIAASSTEKFGLGPALGFALPSPGSLSFVYGGKASARPIPWLRGGLFVYKYGAGISNGVTATPSTTTTTTTPTTTPSTTPTSSVTTVTTTGEVLEGSISNTIIGVEASYPFKDTIGAGLKLGIAKNSILLTAQYQTTLITIASEGSSPFIGPTVYFEAPLGTFSAGAEASYIYTLSSSVPKALLILGTAKLNLF